MRGRDKRQRDRVLPGQSGVVDSDAVGGGTVSFNFCDWWSFLKRNNGRVVAVTQVLRLFLHRCKKKLIANFCQILKICFSPIVFQISFFKHFKSCTGLLTGMSDILPFPTGKVCRADS